MKKRVITGVIYVIVMIGLLVMKLLVPDSAEGLNYGALGIDVLFWLISIIGSYEFTRAVGIKGKDNGGRELPTGGMSNSQRWVAIFTCALIVPAFVLGKVVELAVKNGLADMNGTINTAVYGIPALMIMLSVGSVGAMVVAALSVFDFENSDLKSTAYAELCILYCGLLSSVGVNINHMMTNSEPAILLLIFVVPAVDTFAFFFGKLFGKLLPLKLAPHTSPNKTVIGAVGGIVGGLFAGVLTWLICEFTGILEFVYNGPLHKVLVLMLITVPTSIFAQVGDLFESAIKRNCGVKDMGKMLPGHGGILDRFDSMLVATVPIVVLFMWIH